jgi:hypothetical protein
MNVDFAALSCHVPALRVSSAVTDCVYPRIRAESYVLVSKPRVWGALFGANLAAQRLECAVNGVGCVLNITLCALMNSACPAEHSY